jgi:hypothetical protein
MIKLRRTAGNGGQIDQQRDDDSLLMSSRLHKNHLGQSPPVGIETAEAYPRDGRERPTAFWWQVTPQKNMVHGLLRT